MFSDRVTVGVSDVSGISPSFAAEKIQLRQTLSPPLRTPTSPVCSSEKLYMPFGETITLVLALVVKESPTLNTRFYDTDVAGV